jgi:hypothetical protein
VGECGDPPEAWEIWVWSHCNHRYLVIFHISYAYYCIFLEIQTDLISQYIPCKTPNSKSFGSMTTWPGGDIVAWWGWRSACGEAVASWKRLRIVLWIHQIPITYNRNQ